MTMCIHFLSFLGFALRCINLALNIKISMNALIDELSTWVQYSQSEYRCKALIIYSIFSNKFHFFTKSFKVQNFISFFFSLFRQQISNYTYYKAVITASTEYLWFFHVLYRKVVHCFIVNKVEWLTDFGIMILHLIINIWGAERVNKKHEF